MKKMGYHYYYNFVVGGEGRLEMGGAKSVGLAISSQVGRSLFCSAVNLILLAL
jgi:hypothetical protein